MIVDNYDTSFASYITDGQITIFKKLIITGIDNSRVLSDNNFSQIEEEICAFHDKIETGDEYFTLIDNMVSYAMDAKQPLPIVRFADGEYEFYRLSMRCNGLYRQAESKKAIKKSMPLHVSSFDYVSKHGILAPLICRMNTHSKTLLEKLFKKKNRRNDLALTFLSFLLKNNIDLTASNYIPFYVIYAYLSSNVFSSRLNGKTICILNSDINTNACMEWFSKRGSFPKIVCISIPREYVATQWDGIHDKMSSLIPDEVSCFLVGAGIGSLLVCSDLARTYSVPAIDAGHILNMMNNNVGKSSGHRLFTFNEIQ